MHSPIMQILASSSLLFGLIYLLWIVYNPMLRFQDDATAKHRGAEDITKYFIKNGEHYPTNLYDTLNGFAVWGPNCQIPEIKPFHGFIKNFIVKHDLPNCSKAPSLTSITRDSKGDHVMVFHRDLIEGYIGEYNGFYCCYTLLNNEIFIKNKHLKSIDRMDGIECIYFEGNVTFHNEEDFVYVQCYQPSVIGHKDIFYQNAHSFVRSKAQTKSKVIRAKDSNKNLNVYIIGISGQSQMNIVRSMPKTYNYLQNGWVELKGYNEIINQEQANFFALISGLNSLKTSNELSKNKSIEQFLWMDIWKRGYVSSYADDAPEQSSLHHNNIEHNTELTDYYQLYFLQSMLQKLPTKWSLGAQICLGPEYITDIVLNYTLDFSKEYKNYLKFSMTWLTKFTESCINGPSLMDEKFEAFFKKMESMNLFNNSLVVFLSDRGLKFSDDVNSDVLWWENRLPFIYLRLPEWWKVLYAEKYFNLLANVYRLTSPFDLYLTLQEALSKDHPISMDCQGSRSLFTPIPWNRSCEEACISSYSCTCHEHTSRWDLKPLNSAVKVILDHINNEIAKLPGHLLLEGSYCSLIGFKRILSVLKKEPPKLDIPDFEEITLAIETEPSNAIFSANIYIRRSKNKDEYSLANEVDRIDEYRQQSRCLHENANKIKMYCICQYKW